MPSAREHTPPLPPLRCARAFTSSSQGVFCTVQPFWELIEFLYQHAHELGEPAPATLFLFKSGVLPDPAAPSIARGSRLRIGLNKLWQQHSVADAATAVLMLIVCATSEHEEHIHGVQLTFGADADATCTIWFSDSIVDDENAISDLHDEIAEALHMGDADTSEWMRNQPFDKPARGGHPLVTRAVDPHPSPLLNRLLVRACLCLRPLSQACLSGPLKPARGES